MMQILFCSLPIPPYQQQYWRNEMREKNDVKKKKIEIKTFFPSIYWHFSIHTTGKGIKNSLQHFLVHCTLHHQIELTYIQHLSANRLYNIAK